MLGINSEAVKWNSLTKQNVFSNQLGNYDYYKNVASQLIEPYYMMQCNTYISRVGRQKKISHVYFSSPYYIMQPGLAQGPKDISNPTQIFFFQNRIKVDMK